MATPARAAWPERPVRLVVPFTPGSVTDVVARIVAETLSSRIGRPVVTDNRPGGSGVVGTMAVAGAPGDGHTLLLVTPTTAALNPHLLRRLPYDPIRDFAPVGQICECPYLLVVDPALPARTISEFLDLARQRPGELTYSYGNNSARVAGAALARMAQVDLLGVPFRGGPEALTDVIAGRISATFTDFSNGWTNARSGKVRALGVTSRTAFALAPDVPPIAATLPEFEMLIWFGLSAPASLPDELAARMSGALNAVLDDPVLQRRLADQGFRPHASTPQAWGAFLRAELDNWGSLVRLAGLEPQ